MAFADNEVGFKKLLTLEETVKNALVRNANKETSSVEGDVRYSINPEFSKQYDLWDKKDYRTRFTVGTTSKVLQDLGVPKKTITWDSSKIIKIKRKHPQMTDEIIKQVPEILENPIIVMKSKSYKSRLTLFGEVFVRNKPVLAILEINPTDNNGVSLDELKIASAYKKDSAQNFINISEILYIDENKNRVSEWEKRTRLQLPVGDSLTNSNINISQTDTDVNSYSMPESEENSQSSTLKLQGEKADSEGNIRCSKPY